MVKNGTCMKTETLNITTLKGPLPKEHLKDLARLRISIFRDYPFLYDGSLSYEEKYLEPYMKSDNFLLILVFDGKKIVGASTALPLAEEHKEFQVPFLEKNLNPGEFCYFGESMLEPEYRGKGISKHFFQERESHAKSLGLPSTCFCTINRPIDHPKRPKSFYTLNEFWKKLGYTEAENLVANCPWKELGDVEETNKPLQFWTKEL